MSTWLLLPSYQKAGRKGCTILEEKDAENTKKATKVTLNKFRGYLQEKGLREAELLTSKVKLANACMSNYYYILATHKNLLY